MPFEKNSPDYKILEELQVIRLTVTRIMAIIEEQDKSRRYLENELAQGSYD